LFSDDSGAVLVKGAGGGWEVGVGSWKLRVGGWFSGCCRIFDIAYLL